MVVDNYGNLIEEPFHRNTWCVEMRMKDDKRNVYIFPWHHINSYKTPLDVQKALKDFRQNAGEWREDFEVTLEYRPARRIYRKVKSGFHAKHLQDATSNIWWKPSERIKNSLRSLETKKTRVCDL